MSSSDRSVLGRLASASTLVLLCAFLLWLAIWLIQQIWLWLLVGLIVALVMVVAVRVLRARRDRWFR